MMVERMKTGRVVRSNSRHKMMVIWSSLVALQMEKSRYAVNSQ